jgi:hypothetical protein
MVPIVNEVIALLLDAGAALSDGMARDLRWTI